MGISEGPQDVSFAAMATRQQALARAILQDRRRRQPVVVHRHRRNEPDAQQRADPDQPQAARRTKNRFERGHSPAAAAGRQGRRNQPVHATGAGPDGRNAREPHAVSIQPRRSRVPQELGVWVPRFVDKLRELPELRDVASDQQNNGQQLHLSIDRDTASRLGVTPADDRQHAVRRVRPAANLDHVHAVEPIPRRARSRPAPSAIGRRISRTSTFRPAGGHAPLVRLHRRRTNRPSRSPSITRGSFRS